MFAARDSWMALAVEIGRQDHLVYGEAFYPQEAGQQICQQKATQFLQRKQLVQGRAGHENSDFTFLDRFEVNFLPSQQIIKAKVGFQQGGEEVGAEVTVSAVGENGHDNAVFTFRRQLHGSGHGRPGAHPGKDPFFSRQTPGHLERFLVLDVDDAVQGMAVKDAGDVGFLHIFQALDFVCRIGFDAEDLDCRVPFLHRLAGCPWRSLSCPA